MTKRSLRHIQYRVVVYNEIKSIIYNSEVLSHNVIVTAILENPMV